MNISRRLQEIYNQINALKRYRHTLNLLHSTIIFAKQTQEEEQRKDIMMLIGLTNYLTEHLTFEVVAPRMSGKTTAYNELKDSDSMEGVVFVQQKTLSMMFRGKIRPYGQDIRVLVFDEHCDKNTIEFIAANWLILGYDTYPAIVVIKTRRVTS